VLTEAVRRWVDDVTGAALTHATTLPGATSSTVALLRFDNGTELVLRLHTKDDWLAEEPHIASREAHALQALAGSGIVAPALVAVDPEGEFCGRPAVLMSRLRGRADLSDVSPRRLEALALSLRPVHRLPAPPLLPEYRPYVSLHERAVPHWSRVSNAWRAALELCARTPPSGPNVLIHRDYHPGNVLIDEGAVSGIVDWPNACAGPPEIDVAHCRVNLAIVHGIDVATAFAAFAATDPHRQAFFDLIDCFDLLDEEFEAARTGLPSDPAAPLEALHAMGAPKLTVELVRSRLDEYVADAVGRLTGSYFSEL